MSRVSKERHACARASGRIACARNAGNRRSVTVRIAAAVAIHVEGAEPCLPSAKSAAATGGCCAGGVVRGGVGCAAGERGERMVRVWRVEGVNGWGPYHDGAWKKWTSSDLASDRWPMHGSVPGHWECRFAFGSKADLLRWFPRDLLQMLIRAHGFKVRSLLVDSRDVAVGRGQVAVRVVKG